MSGFIELHESTDGTVLLFNLDLVKTVASRGDGSLITTTDNREYEVREPYAGIYGVIGQLSRVKKVRRP